MYDAVIMNAHMKQHSIVVWNDNENAHLMQRSAMNGIR